MKQLLTIAGSDPSGGAGIQADLKTFAALGTYGMSCICAVVAENTTRVSAVQNITTDMVTAQLIDIYEDIPPDAVKTGMLSTPDLVETVAGFLAAHRGPPVVVDPVMVAASGGVLLEPEAVEKYKTLLMREAALITPNIPEAEILADMKITNADDMARAAEKLMQYGCGAVLVKGGHRVEDALDVLCDGSAIEYFRGERIDTNNTHGTGCTLSSALAVYLAKGYALKDAVGAAKAYLTGALRSAAKGSVGHGSGPVDHFWFYGDRWGKME